jgi:hypothetical protein
MNERFVKLTKKIIKALLLALLKEEKIIFGRIKFSILQTVSLKFIKCESLGMITQKKRKRKTPPTAIEALGEPMSRIREPSLNESPCLPSRDKL